MATYLEEEHQEGNSLKKEELSEKLKYKLVVDGNALGHFLFQLWSTNWTKARNLTPADGLLFFDPSDFMDFMKKELDEIKKKEIEFSCVVFDGAHPKQKKETTKDRLKKRVKIWDSVFHWVSEKEKGKDQASPDLDLRPNHIGGIVRLVLEEMKIPMEMSPGEADAYIAMKVTNSQDSDQKEINEVHAVLSNDTDFLIFPVHYIPLESLFPDENQDLESKENHNKKPFLYPSDALADLLGINPKLLPWFSALVGNDTTNRARWKKQDITDAVKHLQELENGSVDKGEFNLDQFKEHFRVRFSSFRDGVKQYDLLKTEESEWKDIEQKFGPGFGEKLKGAKIDRNIPTLLKEKIFYGRPVPEDPKHRSSFDLCAPLRRRIYGMIGLPSHISVSEFNPVTGEKNVPVKQVDGLEMPDVKNLRNRNWIARREALMKLCGSFNSKMKLQFPLEDKEETSPLLAVAMALRFWNQSGSVKSEYKPEEWEINAFLFMALEEEKEQPPKGEEKDEKHDEQDEMAMEGKKDHMKGEGRQHAKEEYNARALHQGSQFQAVMEHIIILNSLCGFPIDEKILLKGQFFNGKLMQLYKNPKRLDHLDSEQARIKELRGAILCLEHSKKEKPQVKGGKEERSPYSKSSFESSNQFGSLQMED